MKRLYIIGGTMGVGKTSVSRQLKSDLANAVFLDGDWCWDADPFVVTDETKAMVMGNIRCLLNSFLRCSAYDNIIFCWVLHEQAILDELLAGLELSGCCVKNISLTVGERELTERIAGDVERGVRRADVLQRSLARLPLYSALNTVKIDTTGKTIREIAAEIEKL